jgi:uncharacterized membrane protein
MGDPQSRQRLDGIDMLRGLVMVVMALDHVRDYVHFPLTMEPVLGLPPNFPQPPLPRVYQPTELDLASVSLFLTRFITHYCAPVFTFLAGTGGFLAGARNKTRPQLWWFLFSRGLWLAFLELTLVNFSWNFHWEYHNIGPGTLWAIGWSMVILSFLVFLPTAAVGALGVGILAFHNHLDSFSAAQMTYPAWLINLLGLEGEAQHIPDLLWGILHNPGRAQLNLEPLTSEQIFFGTGYCLLPWTGVMLCGYAFGSFFLLKPQVRRPQLFGLGAVMTLTFIWLRYSNLYGDAAPWSVQERGWEFSLFSFLNCTKYPPSLLYALMTLGPAIMLLSLFDRPLGILAKPLIVFGRVPLFFYLLHIPLIHGIAIAIDRHRYGWSPFSGKGPFDLDSTKLPPNYGVDLQTTYLIWFGVILALFPVCYAYSKIKARYRWWWLGYL